jgi:hypothetical protein
MEVSLTVYKLFQITLKAFFRWVLTLIDILRNRFTCLEIVKNKQDQKGKAAFNERNPTRLGCDSVRGEVLFQM